MINESQEENGFCAQCGAANPRTAAFCVKCGAPLPWAATKAETVAPQAVAPVPPLLTAPSASQWPTSPPPVAPAPPVTPSGVPVAGVPVLDGFKSLFRVLFPPELRTAYRGATPQELLRLYGLRVAGLVLLALLVKSYAYSIVSVLAVGMMVCLVVGLKNPNSFRWVFGEKTSRSSVGWTFGALLLLLGIIGSSMDPDRKEAQSAAPVVASASSLATAPDPVIASVPTSAPVQKTASQVRADASKERAARAQAKAQQAKAQRDLAKKVAQNKQAERDRQAAAQAQVEADLSAAPQAEELPSNVTEVDIPGLGKRQVGVVDKVLYTVQSVEKVSSLGRTQADGVFYLLRVVASNTAKKAHNVTTVRMKMVDDQDREFSASSEGNTELLMQGDQGAQFITAKLQPGVVKKFTLVFDAPDDATGLALKIPAGTFSFGKSALIRCQMPTSKADLNQRLQRSRGQRLPHADQ